MSKEKYKIVNKSCCEDFRQFSFKTTSGIAYNLAKLYNGIPGAQSNQIPYLDVSEVEGVPFGITKFLNTLNDHSTEANILAKIGADNWMIGKFIAHPLVDFVRVLPVSSHKNGVYRYEFIQDTSYIHQVPEAARASAAVPEAAQAGGSLYDNKGKLLYRGQMKNGLPHGYGTGYYANGKVGHVGMFKGGKIV